MTTAVAIVIGVVLGAALVRSQRRREERLVEVAVRAALAETPGQAAYSAAEHARARKARQRQLAAIRNRARTLKSDPRLDPELVPSVTAVIDAAQEREP